mgnify:CR=1 FL=1
MFWCGLGKKTQQATRTKTGEYTYSTSKTKHSRVKDEKSVRPSPKSLICTFFVELVDSRPTCVIRPAFIYVHNHKHERDESQNCIDIFNTIVNFLVQLSILLDESNVPCSNSKRLHKIYTICSNNHSHNLFSSDVTRFERHSTVTSRDEPTNMKR